MDFKLKKQYHIFIYSGSVIVLVILMSSETSAGCNLNLFILNLFISCTGYVALNAIRL